MREAAEAFVIFIDDDSLSVFISFLVFDIRSVLVYIEWNNAWLQQTTSEAAD